MNVHTETVFVVMEEVHHMETLTPSVRVAGVFRNEDDARDFMNSSQWIEMTEMYMYY